MEEDLKKKKTCHETFGLLQVGQYPLILLESKRSVSHCHSVLVADALSQMPFKPHQSVVFPEQNCFYLFLLLSGSVGNRPCLCIPSCMQFAPVVSQVHLQISPAFVPNVLSPSYHCALTFQPSSLSFLDGVRTTYLLSTFWFIGQFLTGTSPTGWREAVGLAYRAFEALGERLDPFHMKHFQVNIISRHLCCSKCVCTHLSDLLI